MANLNLSPNDPYTLTIAVDSRLNRADYFNDQIWKLNIQDPDTQALTISSTLGLRAKSIRIFPRFTENNFSVINPFQFYKTPIINNIFPNFIRLRFSPFNEIDVISEYWVPDSYGLAGRLLISNNSEKDRSLTIEILEQLLPINGKVITPIQIDSTTVLSGSTSNIETVLYLTKGAKPGKGSFPSLKIELLLAPKQKETIIWVHAGLEDYESSFSYARKIVNTRWDAKISHIELLNKGNIEIITGDNSWNIALTLSQKVAHQLLISPTTNLPFTSFVSNREPDQGYSFSHDGKDYSDYWRGQTPLDTYYFAQIVQFSSPKLIIGFIKNFLSTQNDDGFIELKPGLGGQKTSVLATPILSYITWEIYKITRDESIIAETFPFLMKFTKNWFSNINDRDNDGIPEWDHPIQINLDYHPAFSHQSNSSNIRKIHFIEPISLSSFLYNECNALIQMAQLLNQTQQLKELQVYQKRLKSFVDSSWDDQSSIYRDRDRSSHLISKEIFIGNQKGSGVLIAKKNINPPGRLLITIQKKKNNTSRQPQIFIHGSNISNKPRIEKLSPSNISWNNNSVNLISKIVYKRIDHIVIRNIDEEDDISVSTMNLDYLDITLLLPLWAKISDKMKAELIVKHFITNRNLFWKEYGLAICLDEKQNHENSQCRKSNLLYTTMVADGLLSFGYRKEAADLFSKIMFGITKSLQNKKCFYKNYDVLTGIGMGEQNVLSGLVPINLLLKIIGVEFASKSIRISGFNPFPWKISIKYRGITVQKEKRSTFIHFPNGEQLTFNDTAPRVIQY